MEVTIIGTRLMTIYYLLCLSTAFQEMVHLVMVSDICQSRNHFRRLSQGGLTLQTLPPVVNSALQNLNFDHRMAVFAQGSSKRRGISM